MKRQITFACAAVCLAGTALAATRYWNPTVQNPQSSGSTTMRYFWSTPENWLDEDGSTGVPQDGDDVVFDKNIQAWAGTSAALHSLTLAKGCTTYPINQTPILLASGGDGLWYTSDQGSLTIYCTLNFRGDGDVPINIPSGKTLTVQKSYMQDTAQAYTVGAALVKRGGGMMSLRDSSYWTAQCTYKRTRLEEGTLQFEFLGAGGKAGPKDLFPEGHDFLFACSNAPAYLSLCTLDLRMKDVKFHESEGIANIEHGISANANKHVYLRFTGTPQLESTVFSGKLYNSAGVSWETVDPAREFVFSNAVSATTGGLLVSNGTMRVVSGASFTSLSNVYVAAGAKFKVEKGAGSRFHSTLLGLEDATAEIHAGEDVVLSFTSVEMGGVAVGPGVYASGDVAWLKGLGRVRVGDATVAGEESGWWERANGPTVLAANVTTNYVGVRLTGGDLAFTAGEGALAFIGTNGFNTAGDGGVYSWGWHTFLEGVQPWQVAAGDTLEITGEMDGLAGAVVRKEGAGTLKFTGAKSFAGDMSISNGTVIATGDESLGGASGTTMFELVSSTEKGVLQIQPEPGKSEVTFHRSVTFHYAVDGGWGNFLILPANTTVNFHGLMSTSDKNRRSGQGWPCHWAMTCPNTTTVHWYGGMYAQLNHSFPGGHHYMHKAMTGGDRFTMSGGAVLELLAPSNSIGLATGGFNNGTIYTRVPYAFCSNASGRRQLLRFDGNGKIDLCGNDQSLDVIHSKDTSLAQITSETPAFMRLVGPYVPDSGNGGYAGIATNRVMFTGAAGLSMEKSTNFYLFADCTTTGTLQVAAGRVTMIAGKSFWTNATEAVVKGGTLVLEHAAAFGTNTVVRFEQTGGAYGQMEIASGVKQKVGGLVVDGVKMPDGYYGSSASVARYRRDDLFAGTGLLKVGDPVGLIVVIR